MASLVRCRGLDNSIATNGHQHVGGHMCFDTGRIFTNGATRTQIHSLSG
jgi:hypothetical protein